MRALESFLFFSFFSFFFFFFFGRRLKKKTKNGYGLHIVSQNVKMKLPPINVSRSIIFNFSQRKHVFFYDPKEVGLFLTKRIVMRTMRNRMVLE